MTIGLVVTLVASLLCALLGSHVGWGIGVAATAGGVIPDVEAGAALGIRHLLSSPAPALDGAGMMGMLVGFCVPWVAFGLVVARLGRNERPGEQSGSARWADRAQLVKFKSAKVADAERDSIILTEHYGMAIKRKGFDRQHDRNLNFLVIGGTGSGKTRYYVKPNVCQMNCDYFITDPKGTLLPDVGQMLVDNGYEVVNFNTSVTERSMHFNPFANVKTDLDIIMWVDGFMALTSDQSKSGGDQFWDDTVKLLLAALIAMLRDWLSPDDYNIGGLLTLFSLAQAKESDESWQSPLDKLFAQLESGTYTTWEEDEAASGAVAAGGKSFAGTTGQRARTHWSQLYNVHDQRPIYDYTYTDQDGVEHMGVRSEDDFALQNYKAFKQAAGKTLKSILISTEARFRALRAKEVRDIMAGPDDLHIERLGQGERPIAIFDTFMDTNQRTLGFIHGMLVWQVIQVCCQQADRRPGGRLPRFTHLILDEFKSLNLPKDIADMISVIRSRNLGMSIILQSAEQLYQMYDEHCANGIVGCCDTTLFLGGGDNATNKLVSEIIGQETIDNVSWSSSHGGQGGYTKQSSTMGRALIDPAEVGRLPLDQALVIIKGTLPGRDTKYPLESHPNYKYIDPGHEGAAYSKPFDLNEYLRDRVADALADGRGLPAVGLPKAREGADAA